MYSRFIAMIEKYDKICIYRHQFPDGDALGSQFGLKAFLENQYPNKQIFAVGERFKKGSLFPDSDIEPTDMSDVLSIVVDTANVARIDGCHPFDGAAVMKIDHHPEREIYGDLSLVDSSASAACEVLARMFYENNVALSQEAATYLYCGLLTDTLQFSIPSVKTKTFEVAAYLTGFGVDIQACNIRMFSSTVEEFKYENYLKSKTQIVDQHLAYIVVDEEEYRSFGLTLEEAKDKVYVLNKVIDFEIYCLFTQKSDGLYIGSLRSKRAIVNEIAAKYNGGGHALASGVKGLTREDIENCIADLNAQLKSL